MSTRIIELTIVGGGEGGVVVVEVAAVVEVVVW